MNSILKNPPNQNIYLRLQEIWTLKNLVPGCNNEGVVLSQFSKLDTSAFCLAHLLTYRDFGCVVGLATVGGLCKKAGNTGFTKTRMQPSDKNSTVNTMAHEVGHNFGADHDGGNSSAYAPCNPKDGNYIMGGGSKDFSFCSIQAMQHRIHEVISEPALFKSCFKSMPMNGQGVVNIKKKELARSSIPCPPSPITEDDTCKDNPDPPEPPKPPPDPVCGNGVLEQPEECDCGATHEVCEDPCCYPGTLSEYDLSSNSSAAPCKLYSHHPCSMPFSSPLIYGLAYSWLFLLILALIIGIALVVDWKYRRCMYGHIMDPEEDIRINTEGNIRH
ncbi:disintegrin and metalloproteinase domain-containing protein 10 homolog [Eurytemora carolleeae]|uniref:disintegrin and metalloproteinase domain-containing protein 10 homolog n=1 Tax=Eurytemora carolleeae TaxID=1294199 RepID=UPI000C769E05|nr:disintegrin and metalloproteinase domain-containing protein 10 homolog [Eurytemora carolleeae]|eukprot:XP_023332807.1 disintegrin and metalloproteinase domain-containing protein 10 homolog [Eurytemora affinis]